MKINGHSIQNPSIPNQPSTSTTTQFNQAAIPEKTTTFKDLSSKKRSRWKTFGIVFAIVLLLIFVTAGGGYYYFTYYNKDAAPNIIANINTYIEPTLSTPTPTPEPIFYPNPITGEMIPEARYNQIKSRPFIATMIQNNTASRPEYGLNEADIVYEALVEGRITRFMAVFWSNDVEKIQSIRSSRKYYVDLLGEYNNPVYMHIGYSTGDTNVNALQAMNTYGIRRVDGQKDTSTNLQSFSRDSDCEKVKAREHCAYTDTARLWNIAQQNNWNNDLTKYKSWNFGDLEESELKSGQDLIQFTSHFRPSPGSGSYYDENYSVMWKYEPITKKYLRYNFDGTPYIDGNGQQVSTSTIIYQKITSYPSGDSKSHQVQEVIGSGTGFIMMQGKVFKVNWSKQNFASRTTFTDSLTGQEFVFQRGRIWLMLMPKSFDYTID